MELTEKKATKKKTVKKKTVKKKSSPGRKKGIPNYDPIDVPQVKCLRCGSTERTKFERGTRKPLNARGMINGQKYNQVRWRRCRCLNCGQIRVERSFHFIIEGDPG